jgi:hypothetical protein
MRAAAAAGPPPKRQWQSRNLTRGAAETIHQFRIEQEFLSTGKSSGNRKSPMAGEPRFVPLKPGAVLGPR